jgi:hypothetical protein
MNKMPYLFFISFTFWKLNPPGWLCLMFIILCLADIGVMIHKHRR